MACVTETHIHAVAVGADQILVAPSLLLARPVIFWEKLAEHKVTIAFAPNFFLALAVRELEKLSGHGTERPQLGSLCDLRHVVSGGEANVVSTGNRFNEAVASLGGPEAVTLRTAFGMTEVRHRLSFPPPPPIYKTIKISIFHGTCQICADMATSTQKCTTDSWRRQLPPGLSQF